jgi:pimeloyl-ACP methyl ester carboxylesterase
MNLYGFVREDHFRQIPWKLTALAALLLAMYFLTSARPVQAQPLDPTGEFTPGPCVVDLAPSLENGQEILCGYLTVPENYEQPDGPTIQLAVMVLKSQANGQNTQPVFFAQGGPGGSTIDTYTKLLRSDNPFNANYDVVLWDQRGTLYSRPDLRCTEMLQATIDTLDTELSDEQDEAVTLKAVQDCQTRLTSTGVDLSAYDSLENAADIEALRKALGYEQINFYGVSYGTLLGFHLLKEYPQTVRSAVLDGVVPPQTNFLVDAGQNMNRSFNALFDACTQDPDCNAAYPDLENAFYDVVNTLNTNPAQIQVLDSETGNVYPALLDGDLFLNTIFQLMYPTEYIPFIPRLIYSARQGDFQFLSNAILPLILFDRTISDGMYLSVVCAEDADFSPADINPDHLPKIIFDNESRDLATFKKICDVWNVAPLDAQVDDPVTSDIPVLLLSGGLDPITPPANASLAAETLSASQNIVFPTGGHGQVLSGECQNEVMLDFLQNPQQPVDTSCIPSKLDFLLPNDILPIAFMDELFGSDLQALLANLVWAVAIGFSILGLFTGVIIYPISWIIQRVRASSQQPPDDVDGIPQAEITAPMRNPWLAHAAWLVLFSFITLLLFVSLFAAVTYTLVVENNAIIFFGFPADNWPIFLLPLVFGLLAVVMLVIMFLRWIRSDGSVLSRSFLSLMVLSALIGVVGLAKLGLFGVLLR